MAKSKLVKVNEKIADAVVSSYKKIEEGAVGGFNKIADKFVYNYLTKEGESIEEARERLGAEQKARIEENKHNAQSTTVEARRKAGLK